MSGTPDELARRILAMVREVPEGRVSTYGRIARIVGARTPRLVGRVLSTAPDDAAVPWHRIVNSRGEISPRGHGLSEAKQRHLLEDEGVEFDSRGRVDLDRYGWPDSVG